MSGEFGEYHVSGYIDEQLRSVARTCRYDGRYEITKLWGGVVNSLVPIAESIAEAEENDTNEGSAILDSLKHIEQVKRSLQLVELYLDTFTLVFKEQNFRKEHNIE